MARMIQNPDGSYTIIAEPGDDEGPTYGINPPVPPGRAPQPGDTLRDGTPATTGGTMSGNPFGTPVSQLALEMAVRNQQTLENIPRMTANQRELLNRRLTRYGGDISQYQDVMDVGYDPTVNAMRSSLTGMRDYLVGLPEVLQKAMKEGETSGVTYKAPPNTNPLQDYLNRIMNNLYAEYGPKTSTGPRVTPDTAEARVGYGQPASPFRATTTSRRVTAQPARRTGGPTVSFR